MILLLLLNLVSYQDTDPAARNIEAHLRFLADDMLEGRDTTERGQKLAARYIASYFQSLGLTSLYPDSSDPYYQVFHLYRSRVHPERTVLRNENATLTLESHFSYADLFPKEGLVEISGAFLGYAYKSKKHKYDSFTDKELEGRFVFMVDGYPPHLDEKYKDSDRRRKHLRKKKVKWVEKAGARGIIILAREDFGLENRSPEPSRRSGFSRRLSTTPVKLHGSDFTVLTMEAGTSKLLLGEHFDVVADALKKEADSAAPVFLDIENKNLKMETVYDEQALPTENVLAVVPGTDPTLKDEYVVLTAHYDHVGKSERGIFNGADDNASGTSLVMDLARRFTQKQTKRSIIFMLVSGEEKGLLGSRHFTNESPVPLEKIVANINMDMVGRNDVNEVGIIPAKNSDISTLNDWVKEINNKREVPMEFVEDYDQYHARSDHYNFVRKDIPAIFFFAGDHPDYHQPSDTIEKINFEKIHRIGTLVEALLERIANDPQRPVFTNREEETSEEEIQD